MKLTGIIICVADILINVTFFFVLNRNNALSDNGRKHKLNKQKEGPYDMVFQEYSVKTDAKAKHILNFMSSKEDVAENHTFNLCFYADLKTEIKGIGMKSRCSLWNKNKNGYVPGHNLNLNNICEKSYGAIFMSVLPIVENCVIRPGVFNFTVPDFNKFVHLFSPRTFYGKYRCNVNFYVGKYGRVVNMFLIVIAKAKKGD